MSKSAVYKDRKACPSCGVTPSGSPLNYCADCRQGWADTPDPIAARFVRAAGIADAAIKASPSLATVRDSVFNAALEALLWEYEDGQIIDGVVASAVKAEREAIISVINTHDCTTECRRSLIQKIMERDL